MNQDAEIPRAPVVEVPLGESMPDADRTSALLLRGPSAVAGAAAGERRSTLAEGMSFSGRAEVDGSLVVSGEFQGDVRLADAGGGEVTVTQTGVLVGDVRARRISVLGQTAGLLDAAGGQVVLHETSSVSGRIRYSHLQVDGADLNAQLERVRGDGGDGPRS